MKHPIFLINFKNQVKPLHFVQYNFPLDVGALDGLCIWVPEYRGTKHLIIHFDKQKQLFDIGTVGGITISISKKAGLIRDVPG